MRTGKHVTRIGVGAVLFAAGLVCAEEVQHLSITVPGGFPGWPVLTGIERATNGARITWDGPAGYYRLYQSPDVTGQNWQQVGGPNLNRQTTISNLPGNAFFRVAGPAPRYAGSQTCMECHGNIHATEMDTCHAHALQTLKNINQQNNASCLPCHTVGYGLPTGFISESVTPHLANVQCESCHGPAAAHAANELDLSARPRKEIAGQLCGGCHTGSHHPTYDEWSSSGHFKVVEDMNPSERINSCGRCHSGSSRLALMSGLNPAIAVTNDANVGITCVVCHDPHQNNVWTNVLTGLITTNQLRYPVASTNNYSLSTSAAFVNRYDINVCAQCHNDRGAAWSSSSRPPHHSPQYNILLGAVGELPAGTPAFRAAHGTRIGKQCVGCHMPTKEYESEAHPAFTGHTFKVASFESCLTCHPFPEELVDFTVSTISNRIQRVKADLDLWALTRAPAALTAKYGGRAWEYTTPGDLSPGGSGPDATEQNSIPEGIKKARFNLYIVKYDGSYGVHNAFHSDTLLRAAQNWVQQELNP